MDPESLQYPVLALSQDGSIVRIQSAAILQKCNAVAFWRNRYYDGMMIIDAGGRTWYVAQVRLASPAGAIARFATRLTNGNVQVELLLDPDTGPDGLAMAKSHVSRWMDRDRDFWEASSDLEDWNSRIETCPDMEALFDLFR